jgi:hypothetical protein
LDYCGSVGFAEDAATNECKEQGDYFSVLEFDSLPSSSPTGYPLPACGRGYYFSNNYVVSDKILHHETFFDAWIRSTDQNHSSMNTIYSRSKPVYTSEGSEDGISLHLTSGNAYLAFEVKYINIDTLAYASDSVTSNPDQISSDWTSVAAYMKYEVSETRMRIEILINTTSKAVKTIANGFWEDHKDGYLGYWGIQEDF